MDELYDEFGNYIGPDAVDNAIESGEEYAQEDYPPPPESVMSMDVDEAAAREALIRIQEGTRSQIVLHEDKQYYPSAEEAFGPGVDIQVQEEDTQPLSEPIVKPIVIKKFHIEERDLPPTTFSREYMLNVMKYPEMTRNIVVVGNLHHGKTSFVDMLIQHTHPNIDFSLEKNKRYTDHLNLERSRGITIKGKPVTLLLQDLKEKSWLFNIMDTPGQVSFVDEVAAGIRMADGAVVVVDVVEGIMAGTEQAISMLLKEKMKMTLVINKIERIIYELKLPVNDAFFKIRHTIEEINAFIRNSGLADEDEDVWRFSPERGNVCFASSFYGWCFTLDSFAKMYADTYGDISVPDFAKRLWGDIYIHPESTRFTRKPSGPDAKRTFVHFILEPMYKLHIHVISSTDPKELVSTLKKVGITLKAKYLQKDIKDQLRVVLQEFFGPPNSFVDMCVQNIPSAARNARTKIQTLYTGSMSDEIVQGMHICDANAKMVAQVVKLYPSLDATKFDALARIWSGTVKVGEKISVLGEGYSPEDEEDMALETVSNLWIAESRFVFTAKN